MTFQLWILWENVWQQKKCRKRYLNLNDTNKRQVSISNISFTAYFVYSHTFSYKSPTHHTESGLPVVKWVNEQLSGLSLCPLQRAKLNVIITGFANFIDEWSHCDFCFTNFGVILEYLESSITTKEAFFKLSSTWSSQTLSWGIHKVAVAVRWPGKLKSMWRLWCRGGSRGRVQGMRTPPWDDLRFSNTAGMLQKKKELCGLLVLK